MMPRRRRSTPWRRVVFLGLALFAAGCTETRTLTIELQTDLAPALELGHVAIEVLPRFVPSDEVGVPVHASTYQPGASDAAELYAGRRVAEVDLRSGTYTVRLVGRRPVPSGEDPSDGDPVAVRDLVITLQADRVVRVVMARGALVAEECRVYPDSCPGAEGAPNRAADRATECLNGRCVDPRCDPSAADPHEYCCEGPSCTTDARCSNDGECSDDGVSCADPRCIEGACIFIDRAGACPADAYCDRTDGVCAPVSGVRPRDAGVPDAGPPEDADPTIDACPPEVCGNGVDDDCDGTLDCEDSECAGFACDDGNPCTSTDVCTPVMGRPACAGTPVADGTSCMDDGNDCTADVCRSGACAHEMQHGTACATDDIDCTRDACEFGLCTHAPRDGEACADDGNECTSTGVCSGTTCTHPELPPGTLCGGGAGRCCGGSCTDPLTDSTNCGICGINCTLAGTTCLAGLCYCPGTNSTCRTAGYGPDATCYDPGGGHRCNCQCPTATTCVDQCPSGARCVERTGHNTCEY